MNSEFNKKMARIPLMDQTWKAINLIWQRYQSSSITESECMAQIVEMAGRAHSALRKINRATSEYENRAPKHTS